MAKHDKESGNFLNSWFTIIKKVGWQAFVAYTPKAGVIPDRWDTYICKQLLQGKRTNPAKLPWQLG